MFQYSDLNNSSHINLFSFLARKCFSCSLHCEFTNTFLAKSNECWKFQCDRSISFQVINGLTNKSSWGWQKWLSYICQRENIIEIDLLNSIRKWEWTWLSRYRWDGIFGKSTSTNSSTNSTLLSIEALKWSVDVGWRVSKRAVVDRKSYKNVECYLKNWVFSAKCLYKLLNLGKCQRSIII